MEPDRRPPAEITPQEFFSTWLPGELRRLGGRIADMRVRVTLSGDGGGSWDLALQHGQLQAQPLAAAKTPLVTLLMTVADWRAFTIGEPGSIDLAPPQASATDILFLDGNAQQLLRTINGTFRFEVTGFNGRTWVLTALFNRELPDDPATATFTIDAPTYARILARELSPPEAYLTGKIAITGDVGLGMQVGLALLPRF